MKISVTKLLLTALLASVLLVISIAQAQVIPDATITFYPGQPTSPAKGVVLGAGKYTIKTPPYQVTGVFLTATNKDGKEIAKFAPGTPLPPDANGVGAWSAQVVGLKGGTYKVKATLFYQDPAVFPPQSKNVTSEEKEIEVAAP
jgi:hypothetical protein